MMQAAAGRRVQLFGLCLARMQRLRPEVLAVEFEKVEGVQDDAIVAPPVVQVVEDRDAALVATHGLHHRSWPRGPEARPRPWR